MKVYQLTNHNGNAWANQFVVEFEKLNIKILQSYKSKVCMIDKNENHITLGDDWDYSKTTMRAVKKFIEENIGGTWNAEEIRRALKEEYITLYNRNGTTEGWTFANGCEDFFNDFFTIDNH